MAKTIKIKRSAEVFQDEREAISFINRISHAPGQPILSRYWASETEIDSILAIGTQTGLGPGTYSIVSAGSIRVVSGIARSETDLPDASQLVNGETWLYQEPVTSDLYWVYINEDIRETSPVDPAINYKVFVLTENTEYWMYGGDIEMANNYYSRETIDRRLQEIYDTIETEVSRLELEYNLRINNVIAGAGLNESGTYRGTITGATSLDDADRLLKMRLDQASRSIQGLSNRLSDIEHELKSTDEGLPGTTRLDEVYSWFDLKTHEPLGEISFSWMEPDEPLIAGQIRQLRVFFHWEWANRASWGGLQIGNEVRPFGVGDVGYPDTDNGNYEWFVNIQIPRTSTTVTASFTGSGPTETFEVVPTEIKKETTLIWPENVWKKVDNLGQHTYSVSFEGFGLPSSDQGDEMSVTQGTTKVFQRAQGSGPTESASYTGTLKADVAASPVTIKWGSQTETVDFKPYYLIPLAPGATINTQTLESATTWAAYVKPGETTTTNEYQYRASQGVVILSPYSLGDVKIQCVSGYGEPLWVTPDFSTPATITYRGSVYNYIVFLNIGAGSFKFIISY